MKKKKEKKKKKKDGKMGKIMGTKALSRIKTSNFT